MDNSSRAVRIHGWVVLVILVLCSTLAGPAPPASSKHRECTDEMTWTYDDDHARATFKIDLTRCWHGQNLYRVKAWIERTDPGAATPERSLARYKCDPRKVCRISVKMEHPGTEATSYRASIEYMPTPNGAEVSHRVLTCVSLAGLSRCEQP